MVIKCPACNGGGKTTTIEGMSYLKVEDCDTCGAAGYVRVDENQLKIWKPNEEVNK